MGFVPILVALSACNPWSRPSTPDAEPVAPEEQAAFADVVAAATDGLVSRHATPRVRLVEAWVTEEGVGTHPAEGTLTLSGPDGELDGVVSWADPRELVFEPAAPLAPGARYVGKLDLGKLDANRAGRVFRFDFEILAQSFTTSATGLTAVDAGYVYEGAVRTADDVAPGEVERLLTATQGGEARTVTWTHPSPREHVYRVAGVARTAAPSTLTLAWDGGPIGVPETRVETVEVAAQGVFAWQSARAVREGEQYVELRFTEPLDKAQKLSGLVHVGDRRGLRYVVDGSVLKIFSGDPWDHGPLEVVVEQLRAADGRVLADEVRTTVNFGPVVPAVKFGGDGVILPNGANRVVPIEVTNVRAVTIEATRVFDGNLPQFLQVNDLTGDRELERVGRVVWRKRVPIATGPDTEGRPVRVGLDVGELVDQDPNALYRLKVSFQRADIVYDCASAAWQPEVVEPEPIEDTLALDRPEASYWDFASEDGGDWWDWEQRDNPCSPMFFRYGDRHEVSRNVLVSDLGVIAKVGQDREVVVVTNHIGTTEPFPAQIRVLDYQLQPLASGATDAAGLGRFAVAGRPFVVEAVANGQRGFVRLDQGSALSTAHFDVGGEAVVAGLKGFFYGERGVWRPGDDVFLTFVLQDAAKKLPAGHPVRFELVNPMGRIVERRSVTPTGDGFYDLRTRTAPDAPTGTWTARVDLGGRLFTQALKVEAIQPNRLKIGYEFDSPVAKGPDPHLRTVVTSRWLHGAKAPGLKVVMDVKLGAKPTAFAKYPSFVFDDPTTTWSGETTTVFEGSLDDEGRADVDVEVPVAGGAPGLLDAEITTRVFEPSGAFSIDRTSLAVSPHARYVGVQVPKGDVARDMLLTDTKHRVEVVLVDADGNPAGDGDVDLALYKIDWRWWWEKGGESLAAYAGGADHTAVAQGSAHLSSGKGSWSFEVKYPDWGRYLLVATDRDGTHRAGRVVYIDWPGWAGRPAAQNPGGATVLSVTSDEKRVTVGQEFHLTFPMAPKGRALVSLETGTGVVSTQWVTPPADGATTVTVPLVATADMAPSVYANVTLLQPHGSTNDLPIRLYGVVPLAVEDPATRLVPKLATAAVWEPDSTAKVTVSESNGHPMTYTLSVVDEGLLGLTRFQTPDPWSKFYGREALGVRTWDLYDLVAGAYGGALEGLLAIGGGDEGEAGAQPQARRFPPMVRHLGPFTLAAGETATHEIDVPGYVGEVRVSVVAGQGGAYGTASEQVPVKKPLMVLATLPRVLGPGEAISVPIDVFALEPGLEDVSVALSVEGPLSVSGDATRRLSFRQPGEQLATFAITTKDALGVGKVVATATSGQVTSSQTIEIGVRHPGVRQTEVVSEALAPGGAFARTLAPKGIAGSNEAVLEVSRVPPLDLGRRLAELIRYPHGCVEQTTSSVFPQVFLPAVTELTPDEGAKVKANVRAGIDRLRSFQTSDGGFGYWPGDRDPHPWATAYVTHFLIEAERAGYVVPGSMKRSALSHLAARANGWVRGEGPTELDQAYRLYVLALGGKADLAAMNRLKELGVGPVARHRLAAAYQAAGQPEVAKTLIAGQPVEVKAYRETGDTFGSSLRDEALTLETLVALQDPAAVPLAARVSESVAADRWLSTQETAQALIALSRFATGFGTNGRLTFDWSAAGADQHVDSEKALVRLPIPAEAGAPVKVSGGSGPLYVRLVTSGLPKVGPQTPASNGLRLEVGYVGADGEFVPYARLPQGTDFTVVARVSNDTGRDLDELVLSQVFASGWELFGTAPGRGEGYDYRDVRDDRVYTYFDLPAGEARDFRVNAHAAYLGRTFLAPAAVEAMYDATVSAHGAGDWVEVVGAESE